MQTTISTNIDNQISSVKTNKASVNVQTQNANQASFNQLLSKELSSQKNSSANSTQNFTSNTNNNNKINNKAPSPAPAPAPSQPTQANSPTKDASAEKQTEGTQSSDEDQTDNKSSNTDQTQNAGAQLLALMGNLTSSAIKPVSAKSTDDSSSTSADALKLSSSGTADALIGNVNAKDITDTSQTTAASAADEKMLATDTTKTAELTLSAADEKSQKATSNFSSDLKSKLESMQKTASDSAKKITGKQAGDASSTTSDATSIDAVSSAASQNQLATSQAITQRTATTDTTASIATTANIDKKTELASDTKIDLAANESDSAKNKLNVAGQQDGKVADIKDFGNKQEFTSKESFSQQLSTAKVSESAQDKPTITPAFNIPAANVSATAAQAVVANEQIAPRVGVAGWDKAVGQKVLWMVGESMQSAELTLNPPDLGPLQVVLNVTNDQASANFFSAQPEVREALESALPRLRQMMSDAGVQLSGFSVNTQASNQGQGFTGQQQEQSSRSAAFNTRTTDNLKADPLPAPTQRVSTQIGMVDTFV